MQATLLCSRDPWLDRSDDNFVWSVLVRHHNYDHLSRHRFHYYGSIDSVASGLAAQLRLPTDRAYEKAATRQGLMPQLRVPVVWYKQDIGDEDMF